MGRQETLCNGNAVALLLYLTAAGSNEAICTSDCTRRGRCVAGSVTIFVVVIVAACLVWFLNCQKGTYECFYCTRVLTTLVCRREL